MTTAVESEPDGVATNRIPAGARQYAFLPYGLTGGFLFVVMLLAWLLPTEIMVAIARVGEHYIPMVRGGMAISLPANQRLLAQSLFSLWWLASPVWLVGCLAFAPYDRIAFSRVAEHPARVIGAAALALCMTLELFCSDGTSLRVSVMYASVFNLMLVGGFFMFVVTMFNYGALLVLKSAVIKALEKPMCPPHEQSK